jgi:hypothetical protein
MPAKDRAAYQRQWYSLNREKVLAADAARYKANPAPKRSRNRKWAQNNREKVNGYARDYNRRNPQKVFDVWLRCKYGITSEDWEWMLIAQAGRCLVCGDPMTGRNEPCVDHCHKTKKVRGLLCAKCNQAIGLLRDSLETAKRLVLYLAGDY